VVDKDGKMRKKVFQGEPRRKVVNTTHGKRIIIGRVVCYFLKVSYQSKLEKAIVTLRMTAEAEHCRADLNTSSSF